MRMRDGLTLSIAACLLLGWWLAHPASTLPRATPAVATTLSACPLPPSVQHGGEPLQIDAPRALALPRLAGATLTPLAGISLEARVLGRENYWLDRGANYSPTDLALGWNRMKDDAVLARLSISQGGRWYHYRWQGDPPIPPDEIARSSANMHMVPADENVARALRGIKAGQQVRIDGWLVRIDAHDGWRWVSSLRRDDTGDGACELVYACAVTRL